MSGEAIEDFVMIQVETNKPTMLLILDGFGFRGEKEGNAIAHAKMPIWESIVQQYPHCLLAASGNAVGLPEGFMGNSEVGHTCLGAGRVVVTSFCKIHDSIEDESFFDNKLLRKKFSQLKESGSALHLMGLLSDAGVHSHEELFYASLKLARQVGLNRVFLHLFLDGRDTPPRAAKKYLSRLQASCDDQSVGTIASLHGRFYAMDRDSNWDRIKKSYDVLCGRGELSTLSWEGAISDAYEKGVSDEFVSPVLLESQGFVKEGDGVLFINFRRDRARLLTESFLLSRDKFDKFESYGPNTADGSLRFFISPVQYSEDFEELNNDVLLEDKKIEHTLLDVIAGKGVDNSVFIVAETEKYAHVTYFFRGKVDVTTPNEYRVLVPSKKVKTYVDCPQMSAPEITEQVVSSLEMNPSYFYLVNYANCDMVGHSGDFEATVKACESIDEQLGILYKEVVLRLGGTIFLVGDHGNAEEMLLAKTGKSKTSHTANHVPFVVINECLKGQYGPFEGGKKPEYGLAHVAPTILTYLKLSIPGEMEQQSIPLR